jgi:hypothetical protein
VAGAGGQYAPELADLSFEPSRSSGIEDCSDAAFCFRSGGVVKDQGSQPPA